MGMFTDFIEQYFGPANDRLVDSETWMRPVVMISNQTGGIVSHATVRLFYRRNRFSRDSCFANNAPHNHTTSV